MTCRKHPSLSTENLTALSALVEETIRLKVDNGSVPIDELQGIFDLRKALAAIRGPEVPKKARAPRKAKAPAEQATLRTHVSDHQPDDDDFAGVV